MSRNKYNFIKVLNGAYNLCVQIIYFKDLLYLKQTSRRKFAKLIGINIWMKFRSKWLKLHAKYLFDIIFAISFLKLQKYHYIFCYVNNSIFYLPIDEMLKKTKFEIELIHFAKICSPSNAKELEELKFCS